jgi:hypothetical protein
MVAVLLSTELVLLEPVPALALLLLLLPPLLLRLFEAVELDVDLLQPGSPASAAVAAPTCVVVLWAAIAFDAPAPNGPAPASARVVAIAFVLLAPGDDSIDVASGFSETPMPSVL